MPAATETALIHIKADAAIEDSSSDAGKTFIKLMEMLAAQKGYQQQYWGRQLEKPHILVWSIDWDDVSSHHAFMKSDTYKDFFALASPIFDLSSKPFLVHTNFASHPPDGPRSAPVTEFAWFTIPQESTTEQKSGLEDGTLKVANLCTSNTAKSFASGWVVEEIPHEKASNGKAIAFNLLVGWDSKDDHMALRENEDFLAVAGPIRGMTLPPLHGSPMYHAKLTKF